MKKKELVKAVREKRINDAIGEEVIANGKFTGYGYELSLMNEDPEDETYRVIRTASAGWHHHDTLIAEGDLAYCSNIIGETLKQKVYNGEII